MIAYTASLTGKFIELVYLHSGGLLLAPAVRFIPVVKSVVLPTRVIGLTD